MLLQKAYAASAQAATHGPHWSAVRVLPWIGHNVTAVQTVSEVIDSLAVDALPALMDATSLVDPTPLCQSTAVWTLSRWWRPPLRSWPPTPR